MKIMRIICIISALLWFNAKAFSQLGVLKTERKIVPVKKGTNFLDESHSYKSAFHSNTKYKKVKWRPGRTPNSPIMIESRIKCSLGKRVKKGCNFPCVVWAIGTQ